MTTNGMPGAERREMPLGTLIFRAGLLTAEQLAEALTDASSRGRRLGQVLLERGLLTEADLARLLAEQKGLPFVSLAEVELDPEARDLLPREVAWLNHALPVGFEDGVPVVAIEDPTDAVVMGNVQAVAGRSVRFVVAARSEIQAVLAPREEAASSAPAPAPAAAEKPPAAAASPPEAGSACHVVLRLADGDRVELGLFPSAFRAEEEARAVVRRLAASSASEWPRFGDRFVRPDTVVAVDLVADGADAASN